MRLKAKVAVEAIRAHKTAAQIAQMFGVHPTEVDGWKRQALGRQVSIRLVSSSMQSVSRAENLWLKIIGFLLILLGLTVFVSPRITCRTRE